MNITYGWTNGFTSGDELIRLVGDAAEIWPSDRGAGLWGVTHPVHRPHSPVGTSLPAAAAAAEGLATVDTSFEFRSDSGGGDPDRYSPTLRRYHQLLWSKPLPCGVVFDLNENLEHHSTLGEFWLTSDAVVHTFTSWPSMKPITEQFPEAENDEFGTIAYTIGAMTVFPGNKIDRMMTINGARGFHSRIRDRFDLTSGVASATPGGWC